MTAPAADALIAVTGATGFVGQAVLDAASAGGHAVRALARRAQPHRAGIEWVQGDLADTRALARLCRGASAVIHIAGVVNSPDAAGFVAGNVTGTLNCVNAALATGVSRFVHVSSLAAREPQLSIYGETKRKGERIVAASSLDWTIVRPPGVFGPRDTEMFELFRLARLGLVPVPPGGRLSLIYVADLAELLLALLPGGEDVTGMMFEPDDGRIGGWTHRELVRAIGIAVNRRAWALPLPRRLLDGVARGDRAWRGAGAKLTPDRVRYMCHPDWTVDRVRAVPATRWQPRIDTPAGLFATAQWYRDNGRL